MTNIYYLLILLFLLPFLSIAQESNLNLGEMVTQGSSLLQGNSRIVTVDDSGYYVQIATSKEAKVIRYNFLHEEMEQWNFDSERQKQPYFDEFIQTKAGVFGIIKDCDKSEGKCYLQAATFNKGQFGKLQTLFEHTFDKNRKKAGVRDSYLSSDDDIFLNLEYNRDSTVISYFSLISKDISDKKRPEKYAVAVFDENMKILWHNESELPYPEELVHTEKVTVSDDGSIFLSARVRGDIYSPAYVYKLFHIQSEKVEEYDIELKDGIYPSNSAIYLDESLSNIQIVGLYNDLNFDGMVLGIFYCDLSLKDNYSEIQLHPFDEKFKNELDAQLTLSIYRDGLLDDKTRLSEVYRAKSILKTKDNKLCFMAAHIDHRDDDTPNSARNYLLERNFLFASFDSKGKLENLINIPREKETKLEDISFGYHVYEDKAYFIFLHKPNKQERKKLGIKTKSSIGVLTVIDMKNNTQSRKTLFNVKKGTTADSWHLDSTLYNGQIYFGSTRYITKYFSTVYFHAGILTL